MLYWNEIIPSSYARKIAAGNIQPPSNSVLKRNNKNRRWFLADVFEKSTIHGFNHLVATNRHPFEKLVFMVALTAATMAMVFMGNDAWTRYRHNATMVVLTNDFQIYSIAYPSVTMCMEDPLDTSSFDRIFAKYNISSTTEAENFFLYLSSATYTNFSDAPAFNGSHPSDWAAILFDLIDEFEYHLISYNTKPVDSVRPKPVATLTELGLCYSIDSGAALYSSPIYWHQNTWDALDTTGYGTAWNLFQCDIELQIGNMKNIIKYFTLHSPDQSTDLNQMWTAVKENVDLTVYFTSEEFDATRAVRELSVIQRSCKFGNEGGLERWPIYDSNMCRRDCRVRRCLEKCGCVPYFARPLEGESVCSVEGMHCLGLHSGYILSRTNHHCHCPPNCRGSHFKVQSIVKSQEFGTKSFRTRLRNFPRTKMVRDVLFGYNDFLVAIGGTAGLFVGASILSFVELFYCFTLRLAVHLSQQRRIAEKKLLRRLDEKNI